jgi:RNA polymerase sigma factor (sigma-70 family)
MRAGVSSRGYSRSPAIWPSTICVNVGLTASMSTEQNPLERFLEYERGAVLAAAIGELPLIHREILTLRFEEELKLEQIAEIIGVPLSTVKSRLLRALNSLRERLKTQ